MKESQKELHLLKIDILCNIIHAFTVTFYYFNAPLLNKVLI